MSKSNSIALLFCSLLCASGGGCGPNVAPPATTGPAATSGANAVNAQHTADARATPAEVPAAGSDGIAQPKPDKLKIDAEVVLADAVVRAASEDKSVLVHIGAPG